MILRTVITLFLVAALLQDHGADARKRTKKRKKTQVEVRKLPDQITFKVDVVRDKVSYKTQGYPKEYYQAFLNAVNMIFWEMEKPNITFQLGGIQWLNFSHGTERIFGATAEELENLASKKRTPIVLLFTNRSIIIKKTTNQPLLPFTPRTGGICSQNNKLVLTHDDGIFFSGVQSVAYKIAILLGARSRRGCTLGSTPSGYSYRKGHRGFHLKRCYWEGIKKSLSSNPNLANCTWNASGLPRVPSPSLLPADVVNGSKFCTAMHGRRATDRNTCKESEDPLPDCAYRCCYADKTGNVSAAYYSFDGDSCSTTAKGVCSAGKCVKAPWYRLDGSQDYRT